MSDTLHLDFEIAEAFDMAGLDRQASVHGFVQATISADGQVVRATVDDTDVVIRHLDAKGVEYGLVRFRGDLTNPVALSMVLTLIADVAR